MVACDNCKAEFHFQFKFCLECGAPSQASQPPPYTPSSPRGPPPPAGRYKQLQQLSPEYMSLPEDSPLLRDASPPASSPSPPIRQARTPPSRAASSSSLHNNNNLYTAASSSPPPLPALHHHQAASASPPLSPSFPASSSPSSSSSPTRPPPPPPRFRSSSSPSSPRPSPAPHQHPPYQQLHSSSPKAAMAQPLLDFAASSETVAPDLVVDPALSSSAVPARPPPRGTSGVEVFSTLVAATAGPALLLIPWGFVNAGAIGASASILLTLCLNVYTLSLLVRHEGSLPCLLAVVFKYNGRKACNAAMIATLLGMGLQLLCYTRVMAEALFNVGDALRRGISGHSAAGKWWSVDMCCLYVFFLSFPLSVMSFRLSLRSSPVALLGLAYVVGFFIVRSAMQFDFHDNVTALGEFHVIGICQFVGILALTGFAGHFYSVEVLSRYEASTSVKLRCVVAANVVVAVCYLLVGVCAPLGFGGAAHSGGQGKNFLGWFPSGEASTALGSAAVLVWLLPVFGIVLQAMSQQTEFYCCSKREEEEEEVGTAPQPASASSSSSSSSSCSSKLIVTVVKFLWCALATGVAFQFPEFVGNDSLAFAIATAIGAFYCIFLIPVVIHVKRNYFSFKLQSVLEEGKNKKNKNNKSSEGKNVASSPSSRCCSLTGHAAVVVCGVLFVAARFV